MNDIDVEEHFRTPWTRKRIGDGKELLVLDMVFTVRTGVVHRPAYT